MPRAARASGGTCRPPRRSPVRGAASETPNSFHRLTIHRVNADATEPLEQRRHLNGSTDTRTLPTSTHPAHHITRTGDDPVEPPAGSGGRFHVVLGAHRHDRESSLIGASASVSTRRAAGEIPVTVSWRIRRPLVELGSYSEHHRTSAAERRLRLQVAEDTTVIFGLNCSVRANRVPSCSNRRVASSRPPKPRQGSTRGSSPRAGPRGDHRDAHDRSPRVTEPSDIMTTAALTTASPVADTPEPDAHGASAAWRCAGGSGASPARLRRGTQIAGARGGRVKAMVRTSRRRCSSSMGSDDH